MVLWPVRDFMISEDEFMSTSWETRRGERQDRLNSHLETTPAETDTNEFSETCALSVNEDNVRDIDQCEQDLRMPPHLRSSER